MAEDGPLATDRSQHADRDLTSVSALLVVSAVLSGNLNLGALNCLSDSAEVCERSGNDKADILGGLN